MEFSDIALAKLLETVPELAKYILTFEDLSEEIEEESGLQVGTFILRSGGDLFYIPVVEKSGNVYPLDSIFFASEQKFFPITHHTISLVESSGQVSQGKPVKAPDSMVRNPSVYHLINPPRTGKHVYASSSRLVDFLAQLPVDVKNDLISSISSEKTVYDKLDKMFGLKGLVEILSQTEVDTPVVKSQMRICTTLDECHTPEQRAAILRQGYFIHDGCLPTRTAVIKEDLNKNGVFEEITALDGDRDYNVVLSNGSIRQAYVPKPFCGIGKHANTIVLFTDGSFAIASSVISAGTPPARKEVLSTIFNSNPPKLVSDLFRGDKFVAVLGNNEFMGPFEVENAASNHLGPVLRVKDLRTFKTYQFIASRMFNKNVLVEDCNIYVPSSTFIFPLGENRSSDLERSLNGAQRRQSVNNLQFLGEELNLTFDGIEFSINGKAIGQVPDTIKVLVEGEGIDPGQAQSFIKTAQETKRTKIYLTKRASGTEFEPSQTTEKFGQDAPTQERVGLNGSFMPLLQESMGVNDAQVAEATIISELLQVPEMTEVIEEYLPDIEDAIDKIGRTLFMARVNIGKLSSKYDPDGIYSFLSSLKNVYRKLGENYMKLRWLVEGGKAKP